MGVFEQDGFVLRFGWGPEDAIRLAGEVEAVVVVDVLRFTSAVDAAVSRGAVVWPYRWKDASAAAFAAERHAELAGDGRWSLSPSALLEAPDGLRLVLPSPNGSTVAVVAAEAGASVFAACIRNASVVASALGDSNGVAVIAAGERWKPDSTLRPAVEDLLGAGAVLAALVDGGAGPPSPEARAAIAAWRDARPHIEQTLRASISGRELESMGLGHDVPVCAEHDVSIAVPVLRDGAFEGRS